MIARDLDEQRCQKCQKLLFRGIIGFGLIEVKCGRCGHINQINSYDVMLQSTPRAYIIVFDQAGKMIAASRSAERMLGYTPKELLGMSMSALDPEFKVQPARTKDQKAALAHWMKQHKSLPSSVRHQTKDGSIVESNARYYPIGTFTGTYTMSVFYKHGPAS